MEDKKSVWALAYQGNLEHLIELLEEDPGLISSKDKGERLPIHWAASGGHLQTVKFLLERNSVFDSPDDEGWTPLIISSSAGHAKIVHLLLTSGSNPDHATLSGNTALHYAASKQHLQILNCLLEYKADIYSRNRDGCTALHRASVLGHTQCVHTLLANHKERVDASTNQEQGRGHHPANGSTPPSCYVDVQDVSGNTALHLACEEQHMEVAKVLVEAGCSLLIRNKEEKTAAEVAPIKWRRQLFDITSES